METPLTLLEFARRARLLYPDREAVVDEGLRLTYEQFFDRCDRWSAVLQRQLGVRRGDHVAYIAPNTHAQLESFYAVPQLGAVLVPINYRLTAEDFAYIIQHSGARVVCAHPAGTSDPGADARPGSGEGPGKPNRRLTGAVSGDSC
jgi:fatty-acyl-CoA synthase